MFTHVSKYLLPIFPLGSGGAGEDLVSERCGRERILTIRSTFVRCNPLCMNEIVRSQDKDVANPILTIQSRLRMNRFGVMLRFTEFRSSRTSKLARTNTLCLEMIHV